MERNHIQPESWATVTPADLIRSVSRRLPSVLVTTACVVLAIGAILLAWPNQYASDGMFYVRLGRGAVSMDPTTEPSRSVSLQESRSAEVMSISQMLNSREIMDRVVRQVGTREINHPRNWMERITRSLASVDSEESGNDERIEHDRQIAHEEAVKKVVQAVSINVPKDSYTISVLAKGSDPLLAQKIVQSIMDQYGAYHVEAHQSTGSLDFFENQTRESHATALTARRALQQARSDMGWMSVKSAEKTLQLRLVELETSLVRAESGFADSDSRTTVLQERLAKIKAWIPMETTQVANAAADGMRTQLYKSQLDDGEKLAKVTPSHPRYKLLREKISSGEEIVDAVGDERQQSTEAINPIRIKLETEYEIAFAKTAGLQSRRDSISQSLAATKDDLKRLNRDAITLAELNWTADIAEDNYLDHSKSLESSRMMHELDLQEMSDVSVIQNASLNLKKVGPPRLALFVLGGLLGLCVGIFQALVRDHSVASPSGESQSGASQPGNHRPTSRELPAEIDLDSSRPFGSATTPEEEKKDWISVPR